MSKLGVHVSSGDRHGFGEFLKKCADAGSPVPVIFAVDQDVWPDVEKHSPQTVVIYRHQPRVDGEGLDAPLGTYHTDPIQSAQDWMDMVMPAWANNPANFYAPINEQDAGDLAGFHWLNDFTVECIKIAEANHLKLALYAFSSGNPRDDVLSPDGSPNPAGSMLEQKWEALLPSMQMAKANGHILLLHEYGFGSPTLKASAPDLALRYRRSYLYLREHSADPKLVISEASAGAGGWSGLPGGMPAWLEDAKWYDSELMKDAQVIGCCLYQLGGAENIKNVLPSLGEYIAATPTPEVTAGTGETGEGEATGGPAEIITPTDDTSGGDQGPSNPPTSGGSTTETTTTPVSTGPLDFNVRLIACREDPDRHNGIILTFQIDATGGNGEYTYTREGQALPGPVSERPASRGGTIVDAYQVTSGDGQTLEKKFFFPAKSFPC